MRDIKNSGNSEWWCVCPPELESPRGLNKIKLQSWEGDIKNLSVVTIWPSDGKYVYDVSLLARRNGAAHWHAIQFNLSTVTKIESGTNPLDFAREHLQQVLHMTSIEETPDK